MNRPALSVYICLFATKLFAPEGRICGSPRFGRTDLALRLEDQERIGLFRPFPCARLADRPMTAWRPVQFDTRARRAGSG